MTRFLQLLDDVANEQSHNLVSVLMRAKIMAAQLSSPTFRNWVDKELNGYDELEEVPDYRNLRPMLIGDFWAISSDAKLINVQLSTNKFTPENRNIFDVLPLQQNIKVIEDLLLRNTETFHHHWGMDAVEYLRQAPSVRASGYVLQCAQSIYTKADISGVLQAIRSRLLDFLLELRDKYPKLEAQDTALSDVSPDVVDQIVQNTFNQCTVVGLTGMANNNISAGRDISVGHDLIITTSIQDSFKCIEDSTVAIELESALKDFLKKIQTICPQLESEAAKQLAEDGKTLVVEAIRAKPRKSILHAVGEAISSTVSTVDKIAVPLTTAVQKIIEMVAAMK